VCHIKSQWYAQCLSSCPPGGNCVGGGSSATTSPPTTAPPTVPSSDIGGACGSSGVPAYSATSVYDTDDQVHFEGRVYSALWYTSGKVPSAGTPWEFVRVCDPSLLAVCGGVPEWTSDATFRAGKRAYYEGVVYQAKWWSSGTPPPQTSSFEVVGNC
jgi:chitodextrinase